MRYQLWTDGSCRKNPGPGGWAFIADLRGSRVTRSGSEKKTTSSRMELAAALMGLREFPDGAEVEIVSDSQYLVRGLNEWLDGWRARSFWGVKNPDLWLDLAAEAARLAVTAVWTKGHAGHPENEECDRLASLAY